MASIRNSLIALAAAGSIAGLAHAAPAVYTLTTVADGKIGSHAFSQARVTLQLTGDTSTVAAVHSSAGNGGQILTNHAGLATVTILDSGVEWTANFLPGEIYVRVDTGASVAGFGSRISPTYPVALGCINDAYPSASSYQKDCTQGQWFQTGIYGWEGTLGAIMDPVLMAGSTDSGSNADPYFNGEVYSPAMLTLPASLSKDTVLTGIAHFCAGTYTIADANSGVDTSWGDLFICAPSPRRGGIRTTLGDFELYDLVGGSTANLPINQLESLPAWRLANVGALHVEILPARRQGD